MSAKLHHECIRVPVTALATCGRFIVAAEGPLLCFYNRKDLHFVSSEQVFRAQAIHGLSIIYHTHHHVTFVVWGGLLVRAIQLDLSVGERDEIALRLVRHSNVVHAPDWILDLCPLPVDKIRSSTNAASICAAVTAHNALIELTISDGLSNEASGTSAEISIVQLTSSSRSILYSAHLIWDSQDRILVAAGTAFGEIMYWSWIRPRQGLPTSCIHHVFLGHEGSVFGVQISKELNMNSDHKSHRFLASCSDDRTIRVWDVSDISTSEMEDGVDRNLEAQRTRHTGFSNASYDTNASTSDCLAVGWGHGSRVWTVQFLEVDASCSRIFLLSSGEDATSRTWELVPGNNNDKTASTAGSRPWTLTQLSANAYHSGKNIWAITVQNSLSGYPQIFTGGADSMITASPFFLQPKSQNFVAEYTIEDITALASAGTSPESTTHKSSKMAEFFRSYAFIDSTAFIMTTNSGKVYMETFNLEPPLGQKGVLSKSTLIDQLQDISGYSICASEPLTSLAFIAGSRGSIYVYGTNSPGLHKLHTVKGKVGEMFVTKIHEAPGVQSMVLLVTLVGQSVAELLFLDLNDGTNLPIIARVVVVPVSETLTGFTISSMTYIKTTSQGSYALLGFRRGSIAVYSIPETQADQQGTTQASLIRILAQVHGKETVTSMLWSPSSPESASGQLISSGRNGRLAIHLINWIKKSAYVTHDLTVPFGPNIEGLYFNDGNLLAYGFSSKKFVLYDTTAEDEVMSVETGGSHRSWAFQPCAKKEGGGTLVWTRASSMHICCQKEPSHQIVRSGGHGREIKAVAVSPASNEGMKKQLIATGAEDTDIKIFEYNRGSFTCLRTLRKHTTGIQHLQWSSDGEYLFSSGGCEEFYIWRVRALSTKAGDISVICESSYTPESEHSDLRIMSFDVRKRETGSVIAMVFSDSNTGVYSYDPMREIRWHTLAKGVYFTSCLTQCAFLSNKLLLTVGTDGHAVLWPLSHSVYNPLAESGDLSIQINPLSWEQPIRIHQNASKTLATHHIDDGTTLIISGGDDGGLAFLIVAASPPELATGPNDLEQASYAYPPIIVARAHASAVTACAIVTFHSRFFVITSGNDQWVRLWEVITGSNNMSLDAEDDKTTRKDLLEIKRLSRIKTNVADVSSMAVLESQSRSDTAVRVIICGVGMEVLRIEWGTT